MIKKDYIEKDSILLDGKEPYPTSLRGINWIKFLSKNNISESVINQSLYNHYQRLLHSLEYHLLGNHLLENGFSLLFGAYYFKDEVLYKKAKKLLKAELNEQILKDGAHYELSPMYHQILFFRLLDCINLLKLNPWKQDDLFVFLEKKAEKMLTWLFAITFRNGNIPMVNDSTYNIAPESKELFNYAKFLGIAMKEVTLLDSGYRMFRKSKYELLTDVGDICSMYQPGHTHSDIFNFELYAKEKPVIIDKGTSTYEKNNLRQKERSTFSHNTIKIKDKEQTEVWGGFRVGKRAKIVFLDENDHKVSATHNGYKNLGILHTREFNTEDDKVIIKDSFTNGEGVEKKAFFHFHPKIKAVEIINNSVSLSQRKIRMDFDGNIDNIRLESYEYALGFNKRMQAKKIVVIFKKNLTTTIKI